MEKEHHHELIMLSIISVIAVVAIVVIVLVANNPQQNLAGDLRSRAWKTCMMRCENDCLSRVPYTSSAEWTYAGQWCAADCYDYGCAG